MSRLFLTLTGLLAAAMIALPETAAAEPPPNDHFAAATVISSLPFSDSADLTEATGEPGDPQSCANLSQTVWYSITPSTDELVEAGVNLFKVGPASDPWTNADIADALAWDAAALSRGAHTWMNLATVSRAIPGKPSEALLRKVVTRGVHKLGRVGEKARFAAGPYLWTPRVRGCGCSNACRRSPRTGASSGAPTCSSATSASPSGTPCSTQSNRSPTPASATQ